MDDVKEKPGYHFCGSNKRIALTLWSVLLLVSSVATFYSMGGGDNDSAPDKSIDVSGGVPWDVWIPLGLALLGLLHCMTVPCVGVTEVRFGGSTEQEAIESIKKIASSNLYEQRSGQTGRLYAVYTCSKEFKRAGPHTKGNRKTTGFQE